VYLELQNTLAILGNRKIFYTRDSLSLQITDETGQLAPTATLAHDEVASAEDTFEALILPFDSTLRFRINGHAASIPSGARIVLDLPGAVAVIPNADTHTYFISGTLTIPAQKGNPAMAWQGTLELPKIKVPSE